MTGSFSNYLELKLLEHSLGKNSFSMPTPYLALCTVAPTDVSTGTTITEPSTSGTGYTRIEIPSTSLNNATSGYINNAVTLTFPIATAAWGTITHFAVCDSVTLGNMLLWGTVTPNIVVDTDGIVSLAPDELHITLD